MKVSVVMCAQNSESFIEETIKSILCQSFSDFELIIILNCSTDKTASLVANFKDNRIRIYKTNISQLSFNLNFGINLAKGDYIARIDADDVAVHNRLEKQLGIIERFGYDVVGSNVDYIDEDNNYIKTVRFPENNKQIRQKILYKSVLAHPSILIKKDLLLLFSGYFGGKYAQDYDLWLRLMRNEDIQFYNIQESLLKYRIHSKQSKGNKNSYAEVAGYFVKESIYSRKISYLLSAGIYYLKAILK